MHCASRSVARFERPPLPRPRRRLKVFESSVVGSGKERQKNQKRRLWRVAALSFSRQPSISREIYEPARGARAEMAKEAREGMVDGRVEGFSSRERSRRSLGEEGSEKRVFFSPSSFGNKRKHTSFDLFWNLLFFFDRLRPHPRKPDNGPLPLRPLHELGPLRPLLALPGHAPRGGRAGFVFPRRPRAAASPNPPRRQRLSFLFLSFSSFPSVSLLSVAKKTSVLLRGERAGGKARAGGGGSREKERGGETRRRR